MAYFQTGNLWIKQLADGVAELVLDVPGGQVNHLNPDVVLDLEKALDHLEGDDKIRLVILASGKNASFAAGPDAATLLAMSPAAYADFVAAGQRLCDRLASSRLPMVAVLSGACLGAGLELALACDFRVAAAKPSTVLGIPDLEMGLMPGWGGAERLPRTVGLERALHVILGGKRLSAAEAVAWGLVDELARDKDAMPPSFLENPRKRRLDMPVSRSFRQRIFESNRLGRWLIFRGFERLLRNRLPDDMPAAGEAIEAVRVGVREGADAGLARERQACARLFATPAARHLLEMHRYRDAVRRSFPRREAKPLTLGIVGAGSRGSALIYLAITRGHQVVVRESSEMALGFALVRMLNLLQQEATRGALAPADLTKQLASIRGTVAWKNFDEVDIVVDTTEGELDAKRELFRQMESNTAPTTLLVSTSPAISIRSLQEGLKRPERVAGLHFLAPLGRSLLVEVVKTEATPGHIAHRLQEFAAALGRVPHIVPDGPGFLVHRLLAPYFHEALVLLMEGAHPQRIDAAMTRFGMLYGPLAHMDLIGIDVVLQLLVNVGAGRGPSGFEVAPLAWMISKKWLGEKSGVGFFHHVKRKSKPNWPLISHIKLEGHARGHQPARALSESEERRGIQDRLVRIMVTEAERCLQEGLAADREQLDHIMTLAGWAPHRGGPFTYAREFLQ